MAETSSLLNCRRGNSTASSNLVLSAFEQPTAISGWLFFYSPPPSLLERWAIKKQPIDCAAIGCSKAAAPRERKDARAKRVNLVAPATRALPFQSPLPLLAHSLSNPHSRISRTPSPFPAPLLAHSPSTVKKIGWITAKVIQPIIR